MRKKIEAEGPLTPDEMRTRREKREEKMNWKGTTCVRRRAQRGGVYKDEEGGE